MSDAKKDLYAVLGVARDATPGELREAFQELALRHHPDRVGGETRVFQEIAAAYKVLSEPRARARYDQENQPRPPRSASFPGSGLEPPIPEPLIPSTPAPGRPRPAKRPTVVVDPETALWGGEITVLLPVPSACPGCGGLARDPLCLCAGSGRIRLELPLQLRLPPLTRDGAVLPLEIPGIGVIELGIQVR